MTETTYSFVYDSASALKAFKGIGPRQLVLAALATAPPAEGWDGCLVYRGASPAAESSVCIGTSGAGADEAQRILVEFFERQGVEVIQLYEGGPEIDERIAQAHAGRWVEP